MPESRSLPFATRICHFAMCHLRVMPFFPSSILHFPFGHASFRAPPRTPPNAHEHFRTSGNPLFTHHASRFHVAFGRVRSAAVDLFILSLRGRADFPFPVLPLIPSRCPPFSPVR